jgi:hypothetical protein
MVVLVACVLGCQRDALVGAKASGLAGLKAADLAALLALHQEQHQQGHATTASSNNNGAVRSQLRRNALVGSVARLRGGAEVKLKGAKKVGVNSVLHRRPAPFLHFTWRIVALPPHSPHSPFSLTLVYS